MPPKSQPSQPQAPWTVNADSVSPIPLPIDLYRDIVSHVQSRSDVLTLLTVDKVFNYEAERVIYRDLKSKLARDDRYFPLTDFLNRLRIGHHVHTLQIDFTPGWGQPTSTIDFLPVLRSVSNLKVLDIRFKSSSTQYIPDEVPFQLHALTTSYRGDEHFEKFLKSQKELKTLSWLRYPSQTFGTIHISNDLNLPVTTLLSSSPAIFSMILPSQKVERIEFIGQRWSRLTGLGQILSVRSISMGDLSNLDKMAYFFPNVRFLVGEYRLEYSLFPGIGKFKRLEKLHLHWTAAVAEYRDLAARVFDHLPVCSIIEIDPCVFHRRPWRFKRGSRDLNEAEEFTLDDDNEWLKW